MTNDDLKRAGEFVGAAAALDGTNLGHNWGKWNAARKKKGRTRKAPVADDSDDPLGGDLWAAVEAEGRAQAQTMKPPDPAPPPPTAGSVQEVCAKVGIQGAAATLVVEAVAELTAASFPAYDPTDTGHECVAIVDAENGKRVDGIGEGEEHSVGIPDDMVFEASRASRNLVIVHTHPSSISLSEGDLRNIIEHPTVKANTIVAAGRDGSFYAATVKPSMNRAEKRRVAMEIDAQLRAAQRVARAQVTAQLREKLKMPEAQNAELQREAIGKGYDVDALFAAALAVTRGPALRRAQKNLDDNYGPGLLKYDEFVPEAKRAAWIAKVVARKPIAPREIMQ